MAQRPRSGVDDEAEHAGSVYDDAHAGRDFRDAPHGLPVEQDDPALWPIGWRIGFIAAISALLWAIVIGLVLVVRG